MMINGDIVVIFFSGVLYLWVGVVLYFLAEYIVGLILVLRSKNKEGHK